MELIGNQLFLRSAQKYELIENIGGRGRLYAINTVMGRTIRVKHSNRVR